MSKILSFVVYAVVLIIHASPAQAIAVKDYSVSFNNSSTATKAFDSINGALKSSVGDLVVSSSPAFSVLEVHPDKITKPATGRDFILVVLQGTDIKGNFQSGLALDFSPYAVLGANDFTIEEYQEDYWQRLAYQTKLSFGTAKGTSANDKSFKLAAGLRVPLFDTADPRLDVEIKRDILKAYAVKMEGQPICSIKEMKSGPEACKEKEKEYLKSLDSVIEKAKADLKQRVAKNHSSLEFGLSPLWISPDGQSTNFAWSGMTFWGTYMKQLVDYNVALYSRYKLHAKETDSVTTKSALNDNLSVGVNATYQPVSRKWYGKLLAMYNYYANQGVKSQNEFQYSVGGGYRVAENVWLDAILGSTTGGQNDHATYVTTQIKWGLDSLTFDFK
jgi:hypothetical protein